MKNEIIEVDGSKWLVTEAVSKEEALNAIAFARCTGSRGSKHTAQSDDGVVRVLAEVSKITAFKVKKNIATPLTDKLQSKACDEASEANHTYEMAQHHLQEAYDFAREFEVKLNAEQEKVRELRYALELISSAKQSCDSQHAFEYIQGIVRAILEKNK
jgi:hypothetical protein